MKDRAGFPLVILILAVLAFALAACASGRGPILYAMPEELGAARSPQRADPASAAQLAEGALHLLNPERPGGPDYYGAARMGLLAAETSDRRVERELRDACYRLAARSALRSGDRELYLEVVAAWESDASRIQRESGELTIHRAIRNRLQGQAHGARVPHDLARLIPPPGEDGR